MYYPAAWLIGSPYQVQFTKSIKLLAEITFFAYSECGSSFHELCPAKQGHICCIERWFLKQTSSVLKRQLLHASLLLIMFWSPGSDPTTGLSPHAIHSGSPTRKEHEKIKKKIHADASIPWYGADFNCTIDTVHNIRWYDTLVVFIYIYTVKIMSVKFVVCEEI